MLLMTINYKTSTRDVDISRGNDITQHIFGLVKLFTHPSEYPSLRKLIHFALKATVRTSTIFFDILSYLMRQELTCRPLTVTYGATLRATALLRCATELIK